LNGNKGSFFLRKLIHVAFSLFLLCGTYYLEKRTFLLLLFVCFLAESLWEFIRLKKPDSLPRFLRVKSLLKEREAKTFTDAWYFILGILIASLFLWDSLLQALILIVGISDTVAYFVGKSLDGPKILHGKTLYGSLSFFISTVLILYAFGLTKVVGVVYLFLLAALLTLSEALFKRDNLSIPIVYVLLLTIILNQLKLF
jgi:dolichol kinase